jgi:phospholipid/cholesterol/gamma-HCH transport system substrate-binding protein
MSQKKNSEFFKELMVGLFMVVVLGLLVYFTIIISGIDVLKGTSKIPVQAVFSDVGGLKVRDSVMLRGMTVGSVEDMTLESGNVKVTLSVQGGLKVHDGYRLSVCAGSLLGGNYLLLEDGKGAELPADTILQGETPHQWMRDLGQVVADLKDATAGGHLKSILTNLDASVISIKAAVQRVEEGKGTLGKLFSEDMALYNDLSNTVASLRSIAVKIDQGTNSLGRLINDDGGVYNNIQSITADLKSISGRLERGEGTLGKLLSNDDTVYKDVQDIAARLKNVAVRLDNGEGTLGKLMKDDNKVYNDLEATVANLKTVTDRLEKGEGTLGKLSKDDALYEDVHGMIKDVRQTVDNFRDTMPISAFASLIMGGL